MRILIVSVTTGGGHNASAESLSAEFERLKAAGADIDVAREDFFEYIGDFFYKFMDKGYLFVTQFFPELFGKSYDTLEHNDTMRRAIELFSGSDYIAARFGKYFHGNAPDVILTTHVFSASALSGLKGKKRIDVPIIGVVTDYCIHPFWEDCKFLDYMVTADELFSANAVKRGIAPSRILPFGIPVRNKFLVNLDKKESRKLLGLDEDKRTVLVMGGSMGYGDIQTVVEDILEMDEDYQVVAICGNNKQLLKNLSRINHFDLHPYGFVDNVEQYMDAADCIITKPGGLTCTEFLVKNLPAILINPIPGPEQRNMQFLCNSGCGMHVGKSFSVAEALHLMFNDPDKLTEMKYSLRKYAKPDAAERICKFALSLS